VTDTLFVYRPGFSDDGISYFCPFSAQIVGFLTYYPTVRDTLLLVELGFDKPRHPLVDMLGESHQAAPVLVLATAPAVVPRVTVSEANGHRFVEKTIEILRYLAATRGVPGPH
jgi:hypothetical protein